MSDAESEQVSRPKTYWAGHSRDERTTDITAERLGSALTKHRPAIVAHPLPLLLEVAKCVTHYREAQGSSPWSSYERSNRSLDNRDPPRLERLRNNNVDHRCQVKGSTPCCCNSQLT